MLPLGQVRVGTKIIFRSMPHEVLEANHLKMGRGGAKLQTKLRNLVNQAVYDYTFAGDERLEAAEISYRPAQFLYHEASKGHFMLSDSYEQISLELRETVKRFLKEGEAVDLMFWHEETIGLNLPKKVELAVKYTEPAVRGNTANAATKQAELETGTTVQVPLFVKTGDTVWINTQTGQYDSRA
jgi:elongation factor P